MSDLIDREEAVEAVKNEMLSWLEGDSHDYRDVVDAIMDLLPVDAISVVHGRWERVHMWTGAETIFCSVCGEDCYVSDTGDDILSNYCPNCGARMNEIES